MFVSKKIQLGPRTWIPFIASETFWNGKVGEISRHRFYLGTYLPVNNTIELWVAYLRQDQKGKDSVHAPNAGVRLNF